MPAGIARKMGDAEWYYGVLRPHCRRVDVWRTTYYHVLPGGPEAIVEWFKGSGLRPFLAPLDPAEQAGFLERYRTGDRRRLSGAGGWQRAAALPTPVHGRDAVA